MYCKKPTLITPCFSEVEQFDLTIPAMSLVPQKKVPNYVEVEVHTVPFWLLLLQGVQLASVFCILMWVLWGENPVLKDRRLDAYDALRAKEKKEAIYSPSRIEEFRQMIKENNK